MQQRVGLPSLRYCAYICEIAVEKLSIEELVRKFKENQTRGAIPDMNEYMPSIPWEKMHPRCPLPKPVLILI